MRDHQALRPSAVLGAAIAILLLALSPSAASASASGCKTRLTGGESCVKVVGHGRYVSTVTTGVRLRPRASWAGVFFTTWPPAAYRYTSGGSFWNESWVSSRIYWGPTITLARYFANGTQICGEALNDANFSSQGRACVTVKD